jgi:hypothetical protein
MLLLMLLFGHYVLHQLINIMRSYLSNVEVPWSRLFILIMIWFKIFILILLISRLNIGIKD